jgi:hypothetical protein
VRDLWHAFALFVTWFGNSVSPLRGRAPDSALGVVAKDLWTAMASSDFINCEHRGGRAGIEENPLQHKLLCTPAELDRDEWKPVLQPDFQEAARIPAQWTSSISTVSLSVCRTYSSR